jgi:pimeloyl-ACP methyl ester carboxylesterase
MTEPENPSLLSVPAFWPMAMAATMFNEGIEVYAKNLEFVEEEIKIHGEKENRFAKGEFIGLGRKLDLRNITCPSYLLAGADDDITTPEQILAAAKHIGTANDCFVQETVPCGHIGLFMGANTLRDHWPRIARWLCAQ